MADDRASIGLPYRRGVGAVLFNADGLVWIGRRIAKPRQDIQNYWQMPQGGIDDEEAPAAAEAALVASGFPDGDLPR